LELRELQDVETNEDCLTTLTSFQAIRTNSRGESEDLEQIEMQDVETNEDGPTTITGPQANRTNSRGESEDLEQRELQDVETNEDCRTVHQVEVELHEVDDLEDRQLRDLLDATSLIDEQEIGPKLIFVKPADVEPVDVERGFLPLGSDQARPSGHRLIRVRPAPGAECEGDVYDETSF
jgi:hypothetical protein